MKILVLDSSFNPPTRAHEALLDQAYILFQPTLTLAMFTTNNADKGLITSTSILHHRQQMMQRMHHHLHSSSVQCLLTTAATRFIDKLAFIQQHFHEHVNTVGFILGMDTLTRFFDPKYYIPTNSPTTSFTHEQQHQAMANALRPFFQHALLLVADRTGHPRPHSLPDYARVQYFSIGSHLEHVSSTRVREYFQLGKLEQARQLVSDRIFEYILHNRLYQNDENTTIYTSN